MNISQEKIRKRKRNDNIIKTLIYVLSSVGALVFIAIISFILMNGIGLISLDFLTSDYHPVNTTVTTVETAGNYTYDGPTLSESEYYSPEWDIVLADSHNKEGKEVVVITYIGEDSPFNNMVDKNTCTNSNDLSTCETIVIPVNVSITGIMTDVGAISQIYGAEQMVQDLSAATTIDYMYILKEGGGIRGSIVTTIYLIILTLLIAVPLGVFTALYLREYAPKNKVTDLMRSAIDLLTGVPSIIYGMMGVAVIIPIADNLFGTNGRSIIAGSMTMAIILLPVIIKNTEESLKIIPKDLRQASLALGASQTQTTFKVVLPSATPGILTGILLGVGRIMGESAALILVMGTAISDNVSIFEGSTTLATHIWNAVGGEVPNYELACAISIVILLIVFLLNIIAKLVANKMNKAWY